jgi:hypothetical protein
MPNFEDLHRELRDMIYKKALVSDQPISLDMALDLAIGC